MIKETRKAKLRTVPFEKMTEDDLQFLEKILKS